MLDPRKKQLFLELTREHIASGTPVGSKVLSEKAGIKRSSATVRNEFTDLEKEGLIFQPHTSAGRVPTEKGWKYYIENLLEERLPSKKIQQEITALFRQQQLDFQEQLKQVAKSLSELSKDATIVGFSKHDVYYTGLSNLFSEPEFEKVSLVRDMSHIIDTLDEVMGYLFDELDEGTHILIGRNNPFGEHCGVVVNKFTKKGEPRVLGILGPTRMAYDTNLGLINFTHSLIED